MIRPEIIIILKKRITPISFGKYPKLANPNSNVSRIKRMQKGELVLNISSKKSGKGAKRASRSESKKTRNSNLVQGLNRGSS